MLDVCPELGRVRCPIEKAIASSTQAPGMRGAAGAVWGPPASRGGGTCRLNLCGGPVVFHGRLMARRTPRGRGPPRQPADLGFGSGQDKRRGGRADGRAGATTVPATEKVPVHPGCLSAQVFTAAPGRPLCVGALARFSS